ncbi:MAG: thiosulfate oxidation carrier protein SoxY [Betaproteobacteria bacterium]|jgi:sulfur-oxidizing protein SoxY
MDFQNVGKQCKASLPVLTEALPLAIQRRRAVKQLALLAAGVCGLPSVVQAQVPTARPPLEVVVPMMKTLTAGAHVQESRVTLTIPLLAENGHLVPVSVSVDSPMTGSDYVKTLYLLSEKNPRPLIAKISFTPGCARASLTTRIRLAGAQYVVALAQMSDNSFWAASAEVVVTDTACLDAT